MNMNTTEELGGNGTEQRVDKSGEESSNSRELWATETLSLNNRVPTDALRKGSPLSPVSL